MREGDPCSVELISVLVLVGIVAVATVTRVHMVSSPRSPSESSRLVSPTDDTVDWLVQSAIRAVGGRAAAIPWVMFAITAAMTAVGSVVPVAIAVVAPMAMGFAKKYGSALY